MYNKFYLEIAKPEELTESIIIKFDIKQDALSQAWASEINKNYDFYERDRFTYFPNNGKDNDYFSDKLNEQIDIINSFYPSKVTLRAEPNMDQQTMNKMHVFFEQLRGPIEDPLDWYVKAPPEVKKAIERLNLLTHEYEYGELYKEWDYSNAMIVGTYDNRPRFELSNDEYKLFTYRYVFGGVYINYCVVGKPILDVFLNNDDVVGDDNIRPQHHWSADWMIKFGQPLPKEIIADMEQKFWSWFERKENFFNSLDITKGPKMSLGQIPVADIDRYCDECIDLTDEEIVQKISQYQFIIATWVK